MLNSQRLYFQSQVALTRTGLARATSDTLPKRGYHQQQIVVPSAGDWVGCMSWKPCSVYLFLQVWVQHLGKCFGSSGSKDIFLSFMALQGYTW